MALEIIAELAQGFEGKPEQTRLLLKAAAAAGADAAKYQLVYADELATPDYQYYSLFKSLEMPDEVWIDLANYALELGVQLNLDIFGKRSLELAESLKVAAVKLHATDIANVGLLKDVSDSSVEKVLLGAGGAYSAELKLALDILEDKKITLLLGFQGYPTPNESNQIARVALFAQQYSQTHPNVTIGFADHASPDNPLKYSLAATAVGAGAKVIEKHLTLGKIMKLEDYESALNPDEFSEFSETLRSCGQAYGKAEDVNDYGMSESEKEYRKMIRRHVVATQELHKGMKILPADLALKRTSSEDIVFDLNGAYQKTLKRDITENSPISKADIG